MEIKIAAETNEASSLPQTLQQRWRTLVVLPVINLALVVVFWQSQLIHYSHDTTGVLFMWMVAGLLFLFIQLGLQYRAWRQARLRPAAQAADYAALWMLGSQIVIFGIGIAYNLAVTCQLLLLGVRPNQPFDLVIAAILAATLIAALALYGWRRLGHPQPRLLLATGTKAVPQWFQAVWLAVQGSTGLHVATIAAINAMGASRYMMARATMRQFRDQNTIAANKAAFRDLVSIIAMAVGWMVGLHGGL